MGDQLGTKESLGNEATNGDVGDGCKAAVNGGVQEQPKANDGSLHPASAEASTSGPGEPKSDEPKMSNTNVGATDGPADVNPDKPTSTAEDSVPQMLPSDPKDEQAVSGGNALGNETTELGSILKGSPFEQEKAKKDSSPKNSRPKPAGTPTQSPKKQSKAPTNSSLNGKPKETQSPKPALQSKPKADLSAAPKAAASSEVSHKAKTLDSKLNGASQPIANDTKPAVLPTASTESGVSKNHDKRTALLEPRTPTKAAASGKQPTPTKASPKPTQPNGSKPEAVKDPKSSTNRTTAAVKPPAAIAKPPKSAPTFNEPDAKPVKKSDFTPPKQSCTKPRPKSPTRPVRLPAAATAPTAASAAKLDGSPPLEDQRKPKSNLASALHTAGKNASNTGKPQAKAVRTSLPTGSKPVDKVNAPKPRSSMAGIKAPEGSFLERMMRPTQSSSQKTHDKAPKVPQSRQHGPKPKRMSEGSDKGKVEPDESKAEPPKEIASTSQHPIESSETKSGSGPAVSVSAAAHAIPATNAAP